METIALEIWGVLKEQGFAVIVVSVVAWRLDQRMNEMLDMLQKMLAECWESRLRDKA